MDLFHKHTLHCQKENDSPLPTPPRKQDFGNRKGSHVPPEWRGDYHAMMRGFFLIIFNNIKMLYSL